MQIPSASHTIVFFDGVCNLCNSSVQWIIRHDRKASFRFAALQGETAKQLIENRQNLPDSVIVLRHGKVYTESAAALQIARELSGWWRVLLIFAIIPKPLRDALYRFVARNRYRWFGVRDACMIPTPELRSRFLA